MSTSKGIPDQLWLVLWREKGYGGIRRDVYVTRAGAERAIRKLLKTDLWDWLHNSALPYRFGLKESRS